MDSGADQESFAKKKWFYLHWNTKYEYVQCAKGGRMGCPGLHGSGVRGKGRGPATLHTLRNSTSGTRAYTHFTLSGHLGLQGQVQEDLFTQRTRFLDRLR